MIKQLTEPEFHTMEAYIRSHYGINLDKKKYLIESKLCFELARYKMDSYTEYWAALIHDRTGEMERRMIDKLTTNYTFFMRERQHFDFLCTNIIPALHASPLTPLTVYCAGCASGQECYTLAMTLLDCRAQGILHSPFTITGADISQQVLAVAQKGTYGGADYARLPANWQHMYCTPFAGGEFSVRPDVRSCVNFVRQNLMDTVSMHGHYNVIFCRNVLIYFRESERTRLITKLTDMLLPGGYLFIGLTESLINCPNTLEYVQPAIYRKPEVG